MQLTRLTIEQDYSQNLLLIGRATLSEGEGKNKITVELTNADMKELGEVAHRVALAAATRMLNPPKLLG